MEQEIGVIGAGFGRTGTLSLKTALERIGFNPCCHMLEIPPEGRRTELWLAAGEGRPVDWHEVLRGYRGTVDWPGCAFYRDIMDAFPEAKVVLTVRDPEAWYESVRETIHDRPSARLPAPDDTAKNRMIRAVVWNGSMQGFFDDKERAIEIFTQHIAEVKRTVPADRLLVFQVKQGWGPLCDFLERRAPSEPFPHVNERATFNDPDKFRALAESRVTGPAWREAG